MSDVMAYGSNSVREVYEEAVSRTRDSVRNKINQNIHTLQQRQKLRVYNRSRLLRSRETMRTL